jgi:hypothetical protein
MANWRDELTEIIRSEAEREAEEAERRSKRLKEALEVADEAMELALAGLGFTNEQLQHKAQPCVLSEKDGTHSLVLRDQSITVAMSRDDAIVKVTYNDGRPREFDFARDRHLSPKDVEEYIGRRAVEFARAVQKSHPW